MGQYFLPKNQQMVPSLPIGKLNDLERRITTIETYPVITPIGENGQVLTADSTATEGVSWQYPEITGNLTYMFANVASDIATYYDAVSLPIFTAGSIGTITTAGVSTTPTLLGTFATELGYPGITNIPVGLWTIHYETEKVAGSNNYYTYAAIYKRSAGGTETLLLTSDNSTQSALNTVIQHTVGAPSSDVITILSTDRIVVKVYAVMLSSTATIHLYFDNNTDARLEMPSPNVDASNFVPYTGATTNVNLGSFDLSVADEAYNATTWNGSLEVPTKNAIRDKIEGSGWITGLNWGELGATAQMQRIQDTASLGWGDGSLVLRFSNNGDSLNGGDFFTMYSGHSDDGTPPKLESRGTSENISMSFQAKGTGVYRFLSTTSTAGQIRLFEPESHGANYIGVTSPSLVAAYTLTLPNDQAPSGDQVMVFDATGNSQWKTYTEPTIDGGGTTNEITYWVDSNTLGTLSTVTYPSLTELSYVKGVTSAIQTQLNNKQPLDTQLTDLAGLSYTGNSLKVVRVNAGETGWELATAGAGDMVLASVQSVTGLKTFDKDKLAMKGTSTGVTTISTANTGASNYTATLQAATGTIAYTSDITGTNSGTNTGDQNIFQTIAVSGQSNVVADTTTDTLTLVAGTNITITTDAATDSITINSTASGGGLTWNEVTGTTQTASVDNGYITNNASQVVVTLPTTAAVGKTVRIGGKGAGGWRVAQNASEIIHFGNVDTTTGTGGYIESTNRYDAVELLCIVADTEWVVLSSQGNITIV